MLGVEDGDMATFKAWSDEIFNGIGEILFGTPSPESERSRRDECLLFGANQRRSQTPKRCICWGSWWRRKPKTANWTRGAAEFCRLLLIAGNETTTGLITASARIFHEEPQTLTRLKAQPDLSASFGRALRYYSPFQPPCDARPNAEIAGQTIAAGELVVPLIASANRDEQVFKNPDTFKLIATNQHLGLGFGIHVCLGLIWRGLKARSCGADGRALQCRHIDGT